MPRDILPIASHQDRRARDVQPWPTYTEVLMWSEDEDDPRVFVYYTKIGDDIVEVSTVPDPGYPSQHNRGYYITILPREHLGERTRVSEDPRSEDESGILDMLAQLRVAAFSRYTAFKSGDVLP